MKKSTKNKGGANGMTFFPPSSSSSSLLQNYQQRHGDDSEEYDEQEGNDDDQQINHNLSLGLFNQMNLSPSKMQQPSFPSHHEEENDMIRGYGLNSANYYDGDDFNPITNQPGFPIRPYYEGEGDMEEEEDEGDGGDDMLLDDKPPEMPQQFYEEVDSFLKKPPPSFKDSGIGGGKAKKSKSTDVVPKTEKNRSKSQSQKQLTGIADTGNEMLPPIAPNIASKGGYSNNSYPPNHHIDDDEQGDNTAMVEKKKRKKVGSKLPQRGTSKSEIDHNLLHEAFAYTDKLLRDAVMDEQLQQQQALQEEAMNSRKGHPRSAPADLEHEVRIGGVAGGSGAIYATASGNNSQGKKKSNGGINAVRNLKKQSSGGGSAKRSDFNVGGESQETDLRRNALNFDELVANFQNGTTLEKLRRELADSRSSLAQSESVIRELSGQYLQPKQQKYR